MSDDLERMQTIIEMKKQDATLEQIGNALGVTRERARQLIDKIVKKHGEEIFELKQPLWTVTEAANEFGVSYRTVQGLCNRGEIPYRRRGKRAYRIDNIGIKALRQYFSDKCYVCEKKIEYSGGSRHKICESAACIKERRKQNHAKTVEKLPSLISLGERQRNLQIRLHLRLLPKSEEWIPLSKAVARSGLSQTQVSWLKQRKILSIRFHPIQKWRGKPLTLYAASEIEIARQVYTAHKEHKKQS